MSAWMSAADMAKDAGAAAEEPRRAWAHAECVTVPVGQCWDVLRVLEGPGLLAVRILRADDLPLGPLLHLPARGVLEFVVPLAPPAAGRRWTTADASSTA